MLKSPNLGEIFGNRLIYTMIRSRRSPCLNFSTFISELWPNLANSSYRTTSVTRSQDWVEKTLFRTELRGGKTRPTWRWTVVTKLDSDKSPLEALQEGERWWVPREKEREVNWPVLVCLGTGPCRCTGYCCVQLMQVGRPMGSRGIAGGSGPPHAPYPAPRRTHLWDLCVIFFEKRIMH